MKIILTLCTFLLLLSCNSSDEAPAKVADKGTSAKPPEDIYRPDTTNHAKKENKAVPALELEMQAVTGELGQVTFSQDEKTVFFYNSKNRKGKVVLNKQAYTLNSFAFDSKTNSYKLSGDGVTITAPDCNYKKQNGEDCNYGIIKEVTIAQGGSTLKLQQVEVQDCPGY